MMNTQSCCQLLVDIYSILIKDSDSEFQISVYIFQLTILGNPKMWTYEGWFGAFNNEHLNRITPTVTSQTCMLKISNYLTA